MLFKEENKYLDIARSIIDNGYKDSSRTGIAIRKLHASSMEFSLLNGRVPVPSTRKVPVKAPIIELLWFISGSTDVEFLKKNNVSIWDSWVKPETARYDTALDAGIKQLEAKGLIKISPNIGNGFFFKYGTGHVNQLLSDLTGHKIEDRKLLGGSIGEGAYGAQWRFWDDVRIVDKVTADDLIKNKGYTHVNETDDKENVVVRRKYDQLQDAINTIKNNAESRRIIVSAWNPGKLDLASLPPCHSFFQFLPFEKNGEKFLDLALTCRSQDFLVGTVFNVMQYSVLCHLVAHLTGRKANKLYWTGNNTHIYENQVELFVNEHSERSVLTNEDLRLNINPNVTSIDDFKLSDVNITGYDNYLERIDYPIAV